MTLPKGYKPGKKNSSSSDDEGVEKTPRPFTRGILWVGVIIVFSSTILGAPLWVSWIGAAMVVVGIYYIFKSWFGKGRKTTAAITFGLIGAVVLGMVAFTTFSIRSAVEEAREVDREIEAIIERVSPNPDLDIGWYYDIQICLTEWELGSRSLSQMHCDAPTIINGVNRDCQLHNNELLICDRNSFLHGELRSYLGLIS